MKIFKSLRAAGILLALISPGVNAQDLQLTSMPSPVSGCNLSCTTDLIVTIYNPGPFIISSTFDISYSVNASAPYTESIFTTIAFRY